jgi:hypothetical protein
MAVTRRSVPSAASGKVSSAANTGTQNVLAIKQIAKRIAKIFFIGKFPFCFWYG